MTTRFFLADTEVKTGKPRSGFSVWRLSLTILLQLATGLAFAAEPPIVDDFSAVPPVVAPDGTVVFTVQAHDPDCPDVCDTGCGQYIRAGLTYWNASASSSDADLDVDGIINLLDYDSDGDTVVWGDDDRGADDAGGACVVLLDTGMEIQGGQQSVNFCRLQLDIICY